MNRFVDNEPTNAIIPCMNCKHYLKDFKCKAFPFGIPDSIIFDGNKHNKPLSNQKNKIVFEPIKK